MKLKSLSQYLGKTKLVSCFTDNLSQTPWNPLALNLGSSCLFCCKWLLPSPWVPCGVLQGQDTGDGWKDAEDLHSGIQDSGPLEKTASGQCSPPPVTGHYSFLKSLFLFLNLKNYCWTEALEVFAGNCLCIHSLTLLLHPKPKDILLQGHACAWVRSRYSRDRSRSPLRVLSVSDSRLVFLAIGHARPWSRSGSATLAMGRSPALVSPVVGHVHAQLLSFLFIYTPSQLEKKICFHIWNQVTSTWRNYVTIKY